LLKSKEKFMRILVFLFVLLWCSAVQAEPVLKSEELFLEVAEKEIPEFPKIQVAQGFGGFSEIPFSARKNKKPEGDIKLGRFEIHPGASITYKYDDNIFLNADQSFTDGSFESPTSDSVAILKGSFIASKELRLGDSWGFDMFYEAQNESFIKTTTEDFLQHDLDAELTLAGLGGRTKITLFGNFLDTVSPANSEFGSNFNPRSERTLTELGERFRWAFTPRTMLSLNAKIGFQRFKASTLQGEDRNNLNVTTSVLWAWTTLTSFGVNMLFDNTHYTAPQTFNNDSNLYGFLLVSRFEPSAFISGDVGIGYQERFVSGGSSRGGFSYKMNLKYDYSDRTKFLLTGERGIQDSTFITTNVNIKTNINIAWEQQWPLLPKFGTRVFFGRENLDYNEAMADTINGGGALRNRNDDRTTVGIDLIYNIQKWLDAEVEYKRIDNSSNFNDLNYLSNVLTLSVKTVF
jgi:hypothetical protein